MGCWNGSCALTNLPIYSGNEIVLIPLFGDAVGHLGEYHPVGLPIIGEYDDYGGIENIKNPEIAKVVFNMMTEAVKQGEISVKQDDRYCKDGVPVDAEQFLECIERGLVMDEKRRNYANNVSEVNYLMMHKSAYDAVIANVNVRVPYEADYTMRHSYEYTFDRVLKLKREQPHDSEILFKAITSNTAKKDNPEITAEELVEIIEKALADNNAPDFDAGFEARRLYDDTVRRWFEAGYLFSNRLILDTYLETPTDELRASIMDLIMIKYVFECGRIPWVPTCGRGSQCGETKIHLILAEETRNIVTAQKYRWDVECDNCIHNIDGDDEVGNQCAMGRTNNDGQCKSFDDEDKYGEESANDPKRWIK
jgi:hypothetical protein